MGWRWKGFVVLILCAWALIITRLVWIQAINHPVYGEKADIQYKDQLELIGTRGTIFDCRGKALAIDLPHFYAVGAVPNRLLKNKPSLGKLAQTLGVTKSQLKSRLRSPSPFVWIDRGVEEAKALRIKQLNIPGVRVARESKRTYPYGAMAAQLLGTTDCDRIGIAGLEHYFDAILRVEPRLVPCWTDARRIVKVAVDDRAAISQGKNLTLTVDLVAQAIAEEELAKTVQSYQAECGTVVITEPQTGKIIALATYPPFDPNQPNEYPVEYQRCRGITDMFEPGSTFKIVVAAAALESGKITPLTEFDCENGRAVFGKRVFRDAHPHGILTFKHIFAASSNIGMAKIGNELGPDLLYKAARDFGFGEPTDVTMDGEARGILHPPVRWSGSSLSNFCIGQGVSTTAIQLAMAYGAIANSGKLLKPQLIKTEKNNPGVKPAKIRDACDPRIAHILKEFMIEAVENGTGKSAAIDHISVAGKTGTAQKVDTSRGTYYQDRFVSSFVGFLPADDPQYLVLVIIDDPKGQHYGSIVAAPAFKRIMQRWLAAETSTKIPLTEMNILNSHEELLLSYEQNDQLNALKDINVNTDSPLIMPTLVGVPIRSAVRVLTQRGMNVSVTGYGIVKSQQPKPGKSLEHGMQCQLIGEKTS